jgi:predicted nuclease with TOPRIM domain
MSHRLVQPAGLALDDGKRLRYELLKLEAEKARLAEEIQRLRDENQDLRDSAAIWIRLYERQLGRANEAIRDSGLSTRHSTA